MTRKSTNFPNSQHGWLRRKLRNLKARHAIGRHCRILIGRILDEKLTYLTRRKLYNLASSCQEIERLKLDGIMIEAGCALGGSTILIAKNKNRVRKLRVFDVFGMIPPPTIKDPIDAHERFNQIKAGKSLGIDGDGYYGYRDDLADAVKSNLISFGVDPEEDNVFLVKGLVQDTLHVEDSVVLAHIDVDWYEPVSTCLRRIFPHLVVGGYIILDDYYDWGGCKKAVDEFLHEVGDSFSIDDSAGSLIIKKIRS